MPNLYDEEDELQQEAPAAPSVRDYIAQRLASNESGLAAVQNQSGKDRALVGIMQGLGQAVSLSPERYNPDGFKDLNANAEQPVADFLQRQKSKSQALSELEGEQKMQQQNEAMDPNSTRSKMVQKIFQRYNPELQEPFSAVDAPLIEKLESTREQGKTRQEIARGNNLYRQNMDQQKADAELGTKRSQLGSRGANSKYADAIRRAANIQSLLEQYPDLNTMPKKQVNLLFSEIDSMVNGGAPTIAGTHSITPDSVQAKFQDFVSNWENKPRGAELGQYLEEIRPYITDVSGNARKHLMGENKKLVDSYKGRLAADAYQRHSQEFAQEYAEPSPAPRKLAPAPPAGNGPLKPYSDPDKEQRFQEWKRKQGVQ